MSDHLVLIHKDNLTAMVQALAMQLAHARKEPRRLSEGLEVELQQVTATIAPYVSTGQVKQGDVKVTRHNFPHFGLALMGKNGQPPSWINTFERFIPQNADSLMSAADKTNPENAPHRYVPIAQASPSFSLHEKAEAGGNLLVAAMHELATEASPSTIKTQAWDSEGVCRIISSQSSSNVMRDHDRMSTALLYAEAVLSRNVKIEDAPFGDDLLITLKRVKP